MHSLENKLEYEKGVWDSTAKDRKKQIYEDGFKSMEKSGILKKAKQLNEFAPDFELLNAMGKKIKLSNYLKKGPVILTWYRGAWCPYCNITLQYLQQSLPDFKKYGASLIALTPELADSSLKTSEKNNLQFEVLSDIDNKIATKYGIVYKLPPEVAKIYHLEFELHSYNGTSSDELPLTATYVIDRLMIIRYAYLDVDYRKRADPKNIIEVLKKL